MKFSLKLNFPKQMDLLFYRSLYLAFAFVVVVAMGLIVWWSYERFETIDQLKRDLEDFEETVEKVAYDDAMKNRYNEYISNSNPSYLANFSQKAMPLSTEFALLTNVAQFSALRGFYPVQNRIASLRENKGGFNLKTENRELFEGFCLSEHRLSHSVQVNESDLRDLLTTIEGSQFPDGKLSEGRPDLFFKEFHISKKFDETKREVYSLSFSLLRRDKSRE